MWVIRMSTWVRKSWAGWAIEMTEQCTDYRVCPNGVEPTKPYTCETEPKPFRYVPLCPACAEHSELVFYSLCAGCDERKRISKKEKEIL